MDDTTTMPAEDVVVADAAVTTDEVVAEEGTEATPVAEEASTEETA